MEIEQLVSKLGRGQDVALDAATRTNEQRIQSRIQLHKCSRDRQRRDRDALRFPRR